MKNTLDVRKNIVEGFYQAIEQTGSSLSVDEITDDLVLLESGLDSLGFAILVVILEDSLGYDPFVVMENPIYPRTFGDFVKIYEQYSA